MERCQQWNKKNDDFSKIICTYNNYFRNTVMKILKIYELKIRHQKEKQITFKIFFVIKIQT